MPENFLHLESAGNCPTLGKCRKLSYTWKVPEIVLHESAGNCPTLGKCRKLSYTWKVPEIVLHLESAGNCPTLGKCRKLSYTWNFPTCTWKVPENVESAGKFENAQI